MKLWSKALFTLTALALIAGVVFEQSQRSPLQTKEQQGCLVCHHGVSDPDPSHPVKVLGCAACHLGNPHALDKKRAHAGMTDNPGDLRVAEQTCGAANCHPGLAQKVKNSVMATNQGIINTLYYHWLKKGPGAADPGVAELLATDQRPNLALEHFAKLCASCHLWKTRGQGDGEIARRGGGCSACHAVQRGKSVAPGWEAGTHARLSIRVPTENCLRCHNRSARSGLSYLGRYESEGYGTPYEKGCLNAKRLSGGRFYLKLHGDVHWTKAGLACIDCHTHAEVMGDGKRHAYLEGQKEISCRDCHMPDFSRLAMPDELGQRLLRLSGEKKPEQADVLLQGAKGSWLHHIRLKNGGLILRRKLDHREIAFRPEDKRPAHHRLPGHERLSCQACHSPAIPQCYGCHIKYDRGKSQKDKLSGKETPGRFSEGRSFMRMTKPILGLAGEKNIAPFAPCQVGVSVFGQDGAFRAGESFHIAAMTAFDPHSTVKASRSCVDCHLDPKSLGLGSGILEMKKSGPVMRPVYDSQASGLGQKAAPEAFGTAGGRRLHTASRPERRPFNQAELESIMRVGACLPCHHQYQDAIYRDFKSSIGKWLGEDDLPCKKE